MEINAVARESDDQPPAPEPAPPAEPGPREPWSEMPTERRELETLALAYSLAVEAVDTEETLREKIEAVRRAVDEAPRHRLISILDWADVRYDATSAPKDRLARKILSARFRDFTGLGLEELRVLARLKGVPFTDTDDERSLARKLDPRGLVGRLWGRLTGHVVGMVLAKIPDQEIEGDDAEGTTAGVKKHIQQQGLMEGVKTYVKSSLDGYVLEKMDEIEERVDRKLEDIDRKMDRWREKEVRYRLRLIKITLVAAVLVALLSLIYELVKVPAAAGVGHLASYLRNLLGG